MIRFVVPVQVGNITRGSAAIGRGGGKTEDNGHLPHLDIEVVVVGVGGKERTMTWRRGSVEVGGKMGRTIATKGASVLSAL
jgi:hypothetical protein